MSEIKDHKRVNDILLGPLERPALQWLAAHMPSWMTPDILTAIGTFGAVLIAASYALTNNSHWFLWLASLGFVINWFGDSLDGTLARYRKIERPKYGFFIDHTVDAINETIIFLGFGLSPYLRFEIACLALIGYLLMSVLVYVETAVRGVFKISYGKLGPTEIRAIAILINTFIFFFGNPVVNLPFWKTTIVDLAALAITLVLFLIFLGSTYMQAKQLSKEDI